MVCKLQGESHALDSQLWLIDFQPDKSFIIRSPWRDKILQSNKVCLTDSNNCQFWIRERNSIRPAKTEDYLGCIEPIAD